MYKLFKNSLNLLPKIKSPTKWGHHLREREIILLTIKRKHYEENYVCCNGNVRHRFHRMW